MEKLRASHGVTIYWRSFELRSANGPPVPPEYRARIEASRPQLYAMAREQYGLELNVGPFGIDSRPALIGAKFAEAQNVGEAYHDAVFRAYWQEGKSIEKLDILTAIGRQVGLDSEAFAAALQDDRYATAVADDISTARQYGLTAVPALVFQNKYLVSGAQPYPTLVEVVEQIQDELTGAS